MSNTVDYIIRLRDKLSATATKMQGKIAKLDDQFQRLNGTINTFGLIAGGFAVAQLFKMGAELEQTKLKFDILTGSIEEGNKMFDFLTKYANETPYSNAGINKVANTMLAFGQTTEEVRRNIKYVGDVAAGSEEKLLSLGLALSQTAASGRLMGQEVLQYVNAGFNPLQVISQHTGKSMADLKKAMEKGQISAKMVTQAFEAATAQGGRFYQMADKMSVTMAGQWSTVMGEFNHVMGEISLSMKDTFSTFIGYAQKFVKWLQKNKETIAKWLSFALKMTAVVVGLIVPLKLLGGAIAIVNMALKLNPIIAIIMLIISLGAAIYNAYHTFDGFRKVCNDLWAALGIVGEIIVATVVEAIYFLWSAIKGVIGNFKKMWNAINQVSSILHDVFTGDFSSAKEKIIDFGKAIYDHLTKKFFQLIEAMSHIGKAFNNFITGNFAESLSSLNKGFDSLWYDVVLGLDKEDVKKDVKKAYEWMTQEGNKQAKKVGKGRTFGGFDDLTNAANANPAQKAQLAASVTGGGIKQFNIHINSLTGVQNMETNNIKEGASSVGIAFRNELLKALADFKSI